MPNERQDTALFWIRMGATIAILIVAIGILFFPGLTYAPVPRVVLFLLVAILPALLVGAEATTRFELKLGWFLFTTGGAFAAVLGAMWFLNYLAKPDMQIAVFEVLDEKSRPVKLDIAGVVELKTGPTGIAATRYIDGNSLVLIFPEQLPEVTLVIRKNGEEPAYRASVTYAGNRPRTLTLGKDLKIP